jgi:hypothetical protein
MTNNKQQTAVDSLKDFFKQYDLAHSSLDYYEFKIPMHIFDLKFQEAKEMEKEKHEKFNKFLNDEKQLGISDLKTIERIQWYYNTYFNETYGGGEQ